jgi:hypothetical protein
LHRGLLVANAARDGIQFRSGRRNFSSKDIYKVLGESEKVMHVVFDSGHDYNKAMRETMYGWMTLHLKGEGKGEPIAEPAYTIEKLEDLACYPDPNDRPRGFLTPPLFAGKVGRELVAKLDNWHRRILKCGSRRRMGCGELAKLIGKLPMFVDVKLRFDPAAKIFDEPSTQTPHNVRVGIDLTGQYREYPLNKSSSASIVVGFSDSDEAAKKSRH